MVDLNTLAEFSGLAKKNTNSIYDGVFMVFLAGHRERGKESYSVHIISIRNGCPLTELPIKPRTEENEEDIWLEGRMLYNSIGSALEARQILVDGYKSMDLYTPWDYNEYSDFFTVII